MDEHRLIIYGLAFHCPIGKRKVSCPLIGVAHLPFKEKVDWIDSQDIDWYRKVLEFHQQCVWFDKLRGKAYFNI